MKSRQIPPAPRPPSAPAPRVEIDDGWVQWIAENRLRDCSPASMLATMSAAGIDPQEAEHAIVAIEADPVFLAARRHQQLYRKVSSVLANEQRIRELRWDYERIEKRSHVSPAEFFERYVVGSRPVVLTELARDWPARARWSPADLKARFGHLDVEIQAERAANPSYEQDKARHRRTVRLGDFVDRVVAGGPSNDCYLTANNEMLRRPAFAPLLGDIGTLPPFCDRAQLVAHASFWFGPGGTITPLHHDAIMLLHTQVVGRKRWRFISSLETPRLYNHDGYFSAIDLEQPDLARHPAFADVKVLEVVLEPGETIFLPLGWWHQVASLETSLSFSYSNLAFPNTYSYDNPSLRDW
jgi:ribosomal protein L16 Arg81 hydroxylase